VASRLLHESLSANHFDNVALHKAAMGRARGQVWFTDAADNELSKVTPVGSPGGRHVPMESLDALYADGELHDLDFIKIDAEEHEGEVIMGGAVFFERESPVVMIEVSESHGPSQMLESMGYQRFRFCLGTGCLLPFTGDRPGEKNFNLFLCKSDRAEDLCHKGLLAPQSSLNEPHAAALPDEFLDRFKSLAVVQSCPELLQLTEAPRVPQILAYYTALAELLRSEDQALPVTERAIRLLRAESYVDQAFNDRTTLPELLSFCRIWRNTGRTLMCANALKLIIGNRTHPQFSNIGLPFLPTLSEWDTVVSQATGFLAWLETMMMASLELTHAFSSAFDGIATIQTYCKARVTGYAEEWMERRAVLKALLAGSKDLPAPLFITGTMKHNRAIWRQLAAHINTGGREFPDLSQSIELL
jgi:FkbM family methyltransferase